MNEDFDSNSDYDIPILEILKAAKLEANNPLDAALWKSEIRRKVKEIYSNIGPLNKATVGRRIKSLLDYELVEEEFFPEDYKKTRKKKENRTHMGDKGFRITENGEEYLNENYGDHLAEVSCNALYGFITERYKGKCKNCEKEPQKCLELSTDILTGKNTPFLELDDEIVREAKSYRDNVKDVKEVAGLILFWSYLQRAIKNEMKADHGKEKNEVLKRLARRDPRIAELVFSTYILPDEDIKDIYEEWGKGLNMVLPADQYLVIDVLKDNEKGLTKDEIKKQLEEIGVTYDPSITLRHLANKGLLKKIEKKGKTKYKLQEV